MKNTVTMTALLISLFFFMFGCVSLETATLNGPEETTIADSKDKITLFGKEKADLSHWYSCVTGKPGLSIRNSALEVSIDNPLGDCFGMYFDAMDITKTPVIKLKIKYTGDIDKAGAADILPGFMDSNNNKTYYPEKAKIVKTGQDLLTLYFDYRHEFNMHEKQIDPGKVTNILFFINILGVKNLHGQFTIEELSLVSKPSQQ
jgi:hypothetical protein